MPPENHLLEYARFHEIATDHRTAHFHQFWTVSLDEGANLPDLRDFVIQDQSDIISEPKLQLSKTGAQILASSISQPPKPDWRDSLSDHHKFQNLKIETLLLKADGKNDAKEVPKMSPDHCKEFEIPQVISGDEEEEEDEPDGITWPADLLELAGQWENDISHEKLHITKETMQYLDRTLRSTFTDTDQSSIMEDLLKNNNTITHHHPLPSHIDGLQKLNPKHLPIMHMREERLFELYTQSPGSVEMARASDSREVEFPFRQEMQKDMARENEIEFTDAKSIREKSDTVLHIVACEPERCSRDGSHSMVDDILDETDADEIVDRVSLETLKDRKVGVNEKSNDSEDRIELCDEIWMDKVSCFSAISRVTESYFIEIEPLEREPETAEKVKGGILPFQPGSTEWSCAPKKVAFPDGVQQSILNVATPATDLIKNSDCLMDQGSLEVTDADLRELADASVFKVEQDTRGKKPRLATGMLKVDLSWFERFNDEVHLSPDERAEPPDALLETLREDVSIPETSIAWRGEEQLNWVAVPHFITQNIVDEVIGDSRYLEKIVTSPKDIIQSSQLLWSRDKEDLLDLSDDSVEEDLQVGNSKKQSLLLKIFPSLKRKALHDLISEARLSSVTSVQKANILRGGFMATDALSSFLFTRGEKFKKPKLIGKHSKGLEEATIHLTERIQNEGQREVVPKRCREDYANVQVRSTPPSEANMLPIPDLPHLDADTPRTVCLNSYLLQTHRGLIRFLENWGGSELTIFYRELGAGNRVSPRKPEAAPDIILSPSESLVFTDLQALTQRALPGQGSGGKSLTHERVSALCDEYKKLFVLVKFPTRDGCMNSSEDTAMLQSKAFCARLGKQSCCEVIPIFIPLDEKSRKHSQELYFWTASLIVENAFVLPSQDSEMVEFLQDETSEELFLRKAGMNAFAAQVLLGALKRPTSGHKATWDLTAFTQMKQEERLARFEGLVGRRALERISARLHHDWNLPSEHGNMVTVIQ